MKPKPNTSVSASSRSDLSGMPEFTRAIRGLAHVPKAELDAAIEKERQAKKVRQGKKK